MGSAKESQARPNATLAMTSLAYLVVRSFSSTSDSSALSWALPKFWALSLMRANIWPNCAPSNIGPRVVLISNHSSPGNNSLLWQPPLSRTKAANLNLPRIANRFLDHSGSHSESIMSLCSGKVSKCLIKISSISSWSLTIRVGVRNW